MTIYYILFFSAGTFISDLRSQAQITSMRPASITIKSSFLSNMNISPFPLLSSPLVKANDWMGKKLKCVHQTTTMQLKVKLQK